MEEGVSDQKERNMSGAVAPNPALFSCCARQQLHFFKCPFCSVIMCYCDHCASVFPDLRNCSHTIIAQNDGFICPHCRCEISGGGFWQTPQASVSRAQIHKAS